MAMNNKNYAIEINGLKKIYNFKKANAFEALKGINLNIPKQSITCPYCGKVFTKSS